MIIYMSFEGQSLSFLFIQLEKYGEVFFFFWRGGGWCEVNLLMTPPRAAGMRTSQSSINIEFESIESPPLNPLTPRCSFTCLSRLGTSMPLLFLMAPEMSLTATIFPPFSPISRAAQEPTFPKPWNEIYPYIRDWGIKQLYKPFPSPKLFAEPRQWSTWYSINLHLYNKSLSSNVLPVLIEQGLRSKKHSSSCSCISA